MKYCDIFYKKYISAFKMYAIPYKMSRPAVADLLQILLKHTIMNEQLVIDQLNLVIEFLFSNLKINK